MIDEIREIEIDFQYYVAWTVAMRVVSKVKSARLLGISLSDWDLLFGKLAEEIKENQCQLQ